VTIDPPNTYYSRKNAVSVTSPLITASVTGAVGAVTWHWDLVSWDHSPPPTFGTPDASSTTVTQSAMGDDDSTQIIIKATVVDSLGNVGSATAQVDMSTYTWNRFDI